MKSNRRSKRRSGGFSIVEAAVVAFIASVALCGIVASVTTSAQLEKRSRQVSRASASVGSQIEDIRSDARTGWSGLQTTWNAKYTDVAGSTTAAKSTMVASVSTSSTGLTDTTGMWETGASSPNFYFVNVSANVNGADMAALKFQTYVGDRARTTAPAGTTTTTTTTTTTQTTFATQAEQIAAAPVSVTTTGTGGVVMSAQLKNQGSTALTVNRVVVTAKKNGNLKKVVVGGTTLLNATKTGVLSYDSKTLKTPISIPAGQFAVNVNDIVATTKATKASDRVVTVTFTLSDGSSRTVDVQP